MTSTPSSNVFSLLNDVVLDLFERQVPHGDSETLRATCTDALTQLQLIAQQVAAFFETTLNDEQVSARAAFRQTARQFSAKMARSLAR